MPKVTHRFITEMDVHNLKENLKNDPYHKDTSVSFFLETGTVCSVYYLDDDLVFYIKGTPIEHDGWNILKLDIQFVDNNDFRKNIKTMTDGLEELSIRSYINGFDVIVFESVQKMLRKFCIKRLGFIPVPNFEEWLMKDLRENQDYAYLHKT